MCKNIRPMLAFCVCVTIFPFRCIFHSFYVGFLCVRLTNLSHCISGWAEMNQSCFFDYDALHTETNIAPTTNTNENEKKAMVMKNDLHKRRWNEKYFFLNLEILPLNIRGYISTVSQINFVLQIMTNLFAWCMFVCLALLFARFVIVIRLSQRHSREMYRKQRCKMVMCHHIYNTVQVEKIEWNLIAIEIAWLIEKRLSTSSQWWLLEITLCLFMFN